MAETPGFLLVELAGAYHRIAELLELALADDELSRDFALYSLLARSEVRTPARLAHELGMPLSTLVLRVNRLVERGHVRRVRNPRDGRSTLVVLTDEGRARFDSAQPAWARAIAEVRSSLPMSDEEATAVVAAVRRAVEATIDSRIEERYAEDAA